MSVKSVILRPTSSPARFLWRHTLMMKEMIKRSNLIINTITQTSSSVHQAEKISFFTVARESSETHVFSGLLFFFSPIYLLSDYNSTASCRSNINGVSVMATRIILLVISGASKGYYQSCSWFDANRVFNHTNNTNTNNNNKMATFITTSCIIVITMW
jgi:hypothetical protein